MPEQDHTNKEYLLSTYHVHTCVISLSPHHNSRYCLHLHFTNDVNVPEEESVCPRVCLGETGLPRAAWLCNGVNHSVLLPLA